MIFPKTSSHPPTAGDDLRKLALGLACGLHVLGFLLILFPPTFLLPKRDLTEVQTINLFDAGELMQPASSGPKQAASAETKKTPPPEPKKEEPPPKPEPKQEEPPPPPEPEKPEPPPEPEPVPEPPKPEPPPEPEKVVPVEPPKPIPTPPEKAISLEPKKVKKKMSPDKPPPEKAEKAKPEKTKPPKADDKILKSLERIQARVKQKQENQALKDQLSRLRDSLHQVSPTEPASEAAPGSGGVDSGGTAASGPGGGPSSMLDEALKKYYISISRKIHSNWALPDTQDWDPNLEAIAIIVIKRDGTVVETFFEKKSDNIYFDQYVEKAIQAALPMPPFPSDLNEDELEIGLKFRPSGLF